MIICHVCKAECEDGMELCPLCGAELKAAAETEETAEENNIMINPTLLCSFDDVICAEIFKDILKENGIPFSASSEMGEGSIQVLFGGGFVAEDVYVSENDLEKANELLEEFNSQEIEFDEEFFDDGENTDLREEN